MKEFPAIGSRDKLSAEIYHSCTRLDEEEQSLRTGTVSMLRQPIVNPFQRREGEMGRRVSKVITGTGSQMDKEKGERDHERTNPQGLSTHIHTFLIAI